MTGRNSAFLQVKLLQRVIAGRQLDNAALVDAVVEISL